MLISISLPSRLGEPCCAVESERMRSLAARPSIVESITICASTRGALGTVDGSSKRILSTLPTRTPARRTSEPSRSPFASTKRAFTWSLRLKGLMSPDAFRIRKINTPIATSTNMPTRNWLRVTLFVDRGIGVLSLVSTEESVDVGVLRATQTLVCSAENHFALTHHHHLAVDEAKSLAFTFKHHLAVLVHHGILGTDVLHVVHFMRDED